MNKNILKEEKSDIEKIIKKLIKRDFSGNSGQAIKNSSYHLATTIIAKIGAILFTIIVARMLLPELFGLYGIALSTIITFSAFTDLGISAAMISFISKKLGKKDYSKAKGYYLFLFKLKFILTIIVSFILLILSYYLANSYYNKPIFYALLAGAIYLPLMNFTIFFSQVFYAQNNLKEVLIKEVIFQVLRITLIPLTIILFLGKLNNQLSVMNVFIALIIIYAISIMYLYSRFSKTNLKKAKQKKLTKKEKTKLKRYLIPLSLTALSGTFFGRIDMVMLGHFVKSEFIGYYQSAFSLIASASAIITFAGLALFPILTRLKGKKLERGFKKSLRLIILMALASGIFSYFFSGIIIGLIYGQEYTSSIPILQIFSLLLIIAPISAIYETYYLAQRKVKIYASLIIVSTIVNIILNYIMITSLLSRGMFAATIGASIATIISRYFYLGGLIFFRKK